MSMRKRPWNRVNNPVYSLVSRQGDRFNMNICTYVTPVSMKPKRYLIGVYEGTKTLANIKKDPEIVLQFLAAAQYRVVRLLGQQSGKQIDKIKRLDRQHLLDTWKGFPVLREAPAVVRLKVIGTFPGGDHECFLCEVTDYKNRNDGAFLYLDHLKERKIIRS